MDDNTIFRMLYVPSTVDRRTEAEKVYDRRKYAIASELWQEIAWRVTCSSDALWRFCLLASDVFVGSEDIEYFIDGSKGNLDPSTTLSGTHVATFLHAKFPRLKGLGQR